MFISGQCTSTNTHETCSQHTLNMHIHNSNIRICIILQQFTNLPEYTTLYEVCSNIFNRAKPTNDQSGVCISTSAFTWALRKTPKLLLLTFPISFLDTILRTPLSLSLSPVPPLWLPSSQISPILPCLSFLLLLSMWPMIVLLPKAPRLL